MNTGFVNAFDNELMRRMGNLSDRGLERQLRWVDSPQSPHIQWNGKSLLNFSSNDYLGLANHPELKLAATKAVERYGAGAGASRLICGSLKPHQELEDAIAAFKGTEAAISFSSGYLAGIGVITALMSRSDVIILDHSVHACLVDAARLSTARLRVFRHNDLNDLEKILRWTRNRLSQQRQTLSKTGSHPAMANQSSRALIITESIFSMEGDRAPLAEIVSLKEKYGAWLLVDEAHATGLYGPNRRGIVEELGLSDHIEVQMGTLGKSFGAAGGYICGCRALIDYLINRARSFIFSTAPVPAAAAAATAGIRLVQSAEGASRRGLLWQRASQFYSDITLHNDDHRAGPDNPPSCIFPVVIGNENKAVEAAAALCDRGFFVPAIRFPSVGRGKARLRLTVTASHTAKEIDQVIAALRKLRVSMSEKSSPSPPREERVGLSSEGFAKEGERRLLLHVSSCNFQTRS